MNRTPTEPRDVTATQAVERPRPKVPILFVDDRPANLLALEAVLDRDDAYDIVTVHSGEDALLQVANRDFAVVLLDVHMPTMDGFDTAARLRQLSGPGGPVPVIFVTGVDGEASRMLRAYELGAIDFIQKPFDPAVLRAKVAVFAELYRTRQRVDIERASAARALQMLGAVALALSKTRTIDDVAKAIMEEGMRAAQADTCSLYLLDDAATAMTLVGHRGVAKEIVEQMRTITEATSPDAFAALRQGTGAWVETAEEYARIRPSLAHTKAEGPRAQAYWRMPLIAEGRPVGLLGMGFYEERRFASDERAMVATIAQQCAQALLRAARLDREERAQASLGTTLRSIGDAVIATDTEGRVAFMNVVAERLTGWPEAEARGRPLDEVFPIFSEETRAPSANPVTRVLREGRVVGLANHTLLRSRRGMEIPIDDSAAPIRDADGTLFGVVLVFRDVTAEKREQARRDFLARAGAALGSSLDYRATLATVAQLAVPQLADWCAVELLEPGARMSQQVAVAHVDPQKVRWAKELGEKYPPDPDAATGAPAVIRTGKAELYAELPSSLLEAQARDEEHLRIIRELRLESAMVVPLRGRERTLGAMTFIYADSGRRYTEQDLAFAEDFARRAAMAIENAIAFKDAEEARAEERALRREADAANKAKDEFLATVSHELRTPLNAILGWAMTLRARRPSEDLDRGLVVIERNARRQARLIEDLLDVSRIISGKLTLNLVSTNLAGIAEAAVESVTPAAEAKDIRIQAELDSSLTVTADADRLQQVIWNLLANSVKFTPKGGEVSLRTFREGSDVCISVSDSGEGIPAGALPFIFEAFRQADASTTRRHGGLGLGLAIVKQLVAAHGGAVRATSEGGGLGSTFVVALPARGAAPAATKREASSPPASPAIQRAGVSAPRLDGIDVLVVEDDEDARGILALVLEEQGARATTAASAAEALLVLERSRPDVILCDIGMPDMDGYAFIRKVRSLADARVARTPAVAVTAYARRDDAQRAFSAGYQMHVAKPVEPVQIVTIVANLAGLSRGTR